MKLFFARFVGNKWFHLLINAVVFVLMARLLPIHFETNDDVAMCMILNGKYSGTPDGHIVYANALLGWVIAGLYFLTKKVEWYTLALCMAQILAMTGLTYAAFTDKKMPTVLKMVLVLFLYVFWARIIMALQFTTTAGLLCASGCVALLKPSKKWRVAGLIAIVTASLIRFNASALVGILFAPMFIMAFFRDKKYVWWLIGVVGLVLVCLVGDKLCYCSPDWKAYREYDALRGYINDNPNGNLSEDELPEGVNMEDYKMLRWFEADTQVLTKDKLQDIKNVIKQRINLKTSLSNLTQLSGYGTTLAMLFLGYIILFIAILVKDKTVKDWRQRFVDLACPVLVFLFFAFFILYFGVTELLKPRAFLCMLLPLVCQLALLFPHVEVPKTRWLVGIMALLVFVLSAKYVKQVEKVNRLYHANQKAFDLYEYPLIKDRPEAIKGCHSECISPFHVKDIQFHTVGMGWMTKIPFNKGLLENHLDFVDSSVMYLSEVDNPPIGITNAIERNYGKKTRIVIVASNEKNALYKIVSE